MVGHVFMPLMFFVSLDAFMPFWAGVAVWAALFAGLSMALLPRSKGLFIAWTLLGLVFYFLYGFWRSNVRLGIETDEPLEQGAGSGPA